MVRCQELQLLRGPLSRVKVLSLLLHSGARLALTSHTVPWNVVPLTPAAASQAALCQVLTVEYGRKRARAARERAGYVKGSDGGRMLSVKLHDTCEHGEQHWVRRSCGHCWCKMCSGYVHPGTRVALKGPVGAIRNNRLYRALDRYEFLFKECNAGSANLTRMVSQALGKDRVAPP